MNAFIKRCTECNVFHLKFNSSYDLTTAFVEKLQLILKYTLIQKYSYKTYILYPCGKKPQKPSQKY